MNLASEVASRLLQINAIKLSPQNPFTWASGMKSPVYCDNRLLLSYPAIRNFIKKSLVEKSGNFEDFDKIAGVATAGIAYGALLADALEKPFIYVRSKPKAHGRQNLIEGEIKGAEKILVVEDLISTGGSSLNAVEAIRQQGCTVVGVLAIFTYELEEARQSFEQSACKLDTLSSYSAMIEEALKMKFIKKEDFETLKEWRKNPESWHAGVEN